MDLSSHKFDKIDESAPLSYSTIKNTLYEFRRSGTKSSNFNALDQPGHLFFKVIFHFWNGDSWENNSVESSTYSGLIHPTWDVITTDQTPEVDTNAGKLGDLGLQVLSGERESDTTGEHSNRMDNLHKKIMNRVITRTNTIDAFTKAIPYEYHNTAYNFLIQNNELERAEKLKQFITLLSNISTYSPWYFSEISGLDEVLERPFKVGAEEFKIDDQQKQIKIKCLPDAMDNRIGTLLDLYRDVAYSYIWHKEILPVNLRKFDMSIYIFESPIENMHYSRNNESKKKGTSLESWISSYSGQMDANQTNFPVSYKCIELRECEIDYNATKSGYSSLNNTEGFQQIFEIPISVGEAHETRYNSFIDRTIGDMVAIDMANNLYHGGHLNRILTDVAQQTRNEIVNALEQRIKKYENGSIDLFNIIDDITGNKASRTVNKVLLGNIYKTSLSDIGEGLQRLQNGLENGNVGAVIHSGQQIVGTSYKKGWTKKELTNIHTENSIPDERSQFESHDIFDEASIERPQFESHDIFE